MELAPAPYLDRAAAALSAVGAHALSRPGVSADMPGWAAGWDQILAVDGPGTPTVYAFTTVVGNLDQLRPRLDQLSAGLAGAGLLSRGPLDLVAVVVFPYGAEPSSRRTALRLTPSVYHPGLHPSAWAVDLLAQKVYTGRRLSAPEASRLLEEAMGRDGRAATLTPDAVVEAQRRHSAQLEAFRRLMLERQPIFTYGLIALNVLMFIPIFLKGGSDNGSVLTSFGALVPQLVLNGQWWRLFTAMFLHASVTHILFNMTSLFVVGSLTERLYGGRKFLAIYLGSGLAASVAGLFVSMATGDLASPHVGASGAIFGLAGALMTIRFQSSEVIPRRVRDQLSSSMIGLVLINLVLLTFTPHIDNAAHIGGLVAGMALSFVFPLTKRLPSAAGRPT